MRCLHQTQAGTAYLQHNPDRADATDGEESNRGKAEADDRYDDEKTSNR
jgi:hypothetical protein